MKRESGKIEKFGTAGVILLLLAGCFWLWGRNDYPLPSVLEPSYDPFVHPSEATPLQRFVENLRWARNDRKKRKIERGNARTRQAEMIQEFREFKLAGNRFWFSYFPADETAGADGEFSLSESSVVQNLEIDEGGGSHPLSNGLHLVRVKDKTLVLESQSGREEWTLHQYRSVWRSASLPPLPVSPAGGSGFSFPPDYGPEFEFRDEEGNELGITQWSEVPEATVDPPEATEEP